MEQRQNSLTLKQAIGRKLVSKDPPKWEDDAWDVKDDTMKVPYGAKGADIADAWINRYKAAADYLTEETNKACSRLVFLLRYSLAHRIVEQGCQDGGQERDRLSVGLMHWNHVLKEMPACETGQQFIAWLTAASKSSDKNPMKPADRIPVKNVLEGDGLKNNSKVSKEAKPGLPLAILASLAGGVIARNRKPSQALVKHLKNINIAAQSLTNVNTKQESLKLSDLQGGKDLAVSIASGVLESYIEKMPENVDFKTAQKYSVATSWKDRLSVLDKLSTFEAAISVLTAIKDFSKSSKKYGSGYDEFSRIKGKAWMMGKPWPYLRYDGSKDARDRFQRQKLALMRLISGFRTWIGYSTFCGGIVYPSHVPQGAYFEMEVDITPDGKSSPKETARLVVWPSLRDAKWLNGNGSVYFRPSRPASVTSFEVQARPGKVRASTYFYQLRVRLNLDGSSRKYLPASTAHVKNETGHGAYEWKSSGEVE